ncbi:MAG: methyl-accepting chemotaxis protein [Promethearchaeota archaeon]
MNQNKENMKRKFGIKQKLIAYILLLSLLPFFVVTIYNVVSVNTFYSDARLSELTVMSAFSKEKILNFYDGNTRDARLASMDPYIIEGIKVIANYSGNINETQYNSKKAEWDDYFDAFLDSYDSFLEVRIIDNASKIIFVRDIPSHEAEVVLGDSISNTKYSDGYIACSTNRSQDFVYIGDIKKDINQHLYQELSFPIVDTNKSIFLGVLSLSVDPIKLSDLLAETKDLIANSQIYVVNNEGYFLTAHLDSWFLAKGYSSISEIILSEKINTEGFLECIQTKQLITKTSTLDYKQQRVMAVYQTMQINSVGKPWVFVYEVDYNQAMDMPQLIQNFSIWSFIVIAIISTIVGLIVASKIANPIIELSRFTKTITSGDLTKEEIIKIESSDEIKDLSDDITDMKEKLTKIIFKIKVVSDQLASSAEELSSSVEEISGSSQNIAGTQQQITRGAQEQAKMILDIQELIKKLAEGIKKIKENSTKVTQITDIVDNIVTQTNILSLNASIEAAKAGEAGKGFGIVAERIKKLADDSKINLNQALTMTKDILKTIAFQEEKAMDIVHLIDSIASISEETAASTEEASAAAEEIASSMEEISATAESLSEVATDLTEDILFFKFSVDQKVQKQKPFERNNLSKPYKRTVPEEIELNVNQNGSLGNTENLVENPTTIQNNSKEQETTQKESVIKNIDSAF